VSLVVIKVFCGIPGILLSLLLAVCGGGGETSWQSTASTLIEAPVENRNPGFQSSVFVKAFWF
jgi:hypothetical protein